MSACSGGEAGLAQYPRKSKLAPAQVAQPPFPYSLGIAAQGKRTIYVAGQVALDQKGALVGKDDPEAQMIIKNPADFPKIGGVRREFFKEPYPASTAFIASLLNPDWLVEIEAVAVVD